jgi:hypothetical protein
MKKITVVVLTLMLAITASVASLAAKPAPAAGADLLSNLPDGGAVVVVDVQKVLGSSLFAQGKLKSMLDKVQAEISQAGLSLSDINSAAVSFSASKFSDPTIVVSGSFNQQTLLAHARDTGKVKITSEKYKTFDVYLVSESGNATTNLNQPDKSSNSIANQMAFAFLDASTVVAGKPANVKASIDAHNGDKPNVTKNAKLMEGLSQNPASAVRFALQMTPDMTKGLENAGIPMPNFSSLQLVFGDVDMSNGIGVNASLRNDTAEHAKDMAEQLNSLLGMVKGFLSASDDPKIGSLATLLKSLKIANENIDVKINVSIPADMLAQLFK